MKFDTFCYEKIPILNSKLKQNYFHAKLQVEEVKVLEDFKKSKNIENFAFSMKATSIVMIP